MKILNIAFKDLTRSFRSAFAIGMMLVAPMMLTGLIYFAFGGTSSDSPSMPTINVGFVNLDVLPADPPSRHHSATTSVPCFLMTV